MLTALSVKMAERPAGIKGIVNKLKRDKIQINVIESRGVALKHVTYISYSGQVKLDKTDKIIGSQRSRLLCSDKLIFPHHSGYKRFSSPSFSARLCTNTALSILQGLENREALRLGIADRRGRHTDFMLSVLKLCADVTVLTSNLGAYRDALDTALTEMGATAAVTQNQSDLSDCDFIIIKFVKRIRADDLQRRTPCSRSRKRGSKFPELLLQLQNQGAQRLCRAKARRTRRRILLFRALHPRRAVRARRNSPRANRGRGENPNR